jgi:hypothetical protein
MIIMLSSMQCDIFQSWVALVTLSLSLILLSDDRMSSGMVWFSLYLSCLAFAVLLRLNFFENCFKKMFCSFILFLSCYGDVYRT